MQPMLAETQSGLMAWLDLILNAAIVATAVFSRQIYKAFDRPKADICIFEHPAKENIDPAQSNRHDNYHAVVCCTSSYSHLVNAVVTLHQIRIDDAQIETIRVPRVLDWAPKQSFGNQPINIFKAYPRVFDTVKVAVHHRDWRISLNLKQIDGYLPNHASKRMELFIQLNADNLPHPISRSLIYSFGPDHNDDYEGREPPILNCSIAVPPPF